MMKREKWSKGGFHKKAHKQEKLMNLLKIETNKKRHKKREHENEQEK